MPTQARAAVLFEAGKPLSIREITVEDPHYGEVSVRVTAAGLCHSDLSVMHGNIPQPLPAVLGHEAAGIVDSVGPGVESVSPGDAVLLLYRPSCGVCRYCVRGRPGLCHLAGRVRATGRLADGTSRLSDNGTELFHFSGVSAFSERVVLPETGVIKVNGDLPLDIMSVVGCAVLTGFGAVVNAADVRPGESAMVIGCGGIGLNVLQALRISGANPIVAIDMSDATLELARRFGATDTINPSAVDDVAAAVRDITDGGADYAFEAVGSAALVEMSIDAIRPGGEVIVIGAPPPTAMVSVSPLRLLGEEKVIRGSLYGSSNFRVDVPLIVDLWRAGRLEIDGLVQHRYPLEAINEGFAAMEAGQQGRTILEIA